MYDFTFETLSLCSLEELEPLLLEAKKNIGMAKCHANPAVLRQARKDLELISGAYRYVNSIRVFRRRIGLPV